MTFLVDGIAFERRCALTTVNAEITGTHTDFGVLFTVDNLPAEMFDSDGSFPAQNGGGDIRFADAAGTTLYALDVPDFTTNANPALGTAQLWVPLPNVRASQTDTIYVYYNASGTQSQPAVGAANGRNAVWSDYESVLHFEDATTDATGNSSSAGTNVSNSTGTIGGAQDFNGTSSRIDLSLATGPGSTLTLQAWFQIDDLSATRVFVSVGDDSVNNQQMQFRKNLTNIEANIWSGSQVIVTTAATVTTGTWYFGHLVVDGGEAVAYLDAVPGTSDTVGFPTNIDRLTAGTTADSTPFGRWSGDVDEVRLRYSALSADWIATELASQGDPGAFITVGTPESSGGGPTTILPQMMQQYYG